MIIFNKSQEKCLSEKIFWSILECIIQISI